MEDKSESKSSKNGRGDNWDMSDRDLQGNTDSKPSLNINSKAADPKVQNVVFDEIPTLKDSSPPKDNRKEPEIDFFGANLEKEYS